MTMGRDFEVDSWQVPAEAWKTEMSRVWQWSSVTVNPSSLKISDD